MNENEWSNKIIGACIEVHRALGPGLVGYKGVLMDCGLRLDFLVDNKVVVELKAVDKIMPVHKAQVLTYLVTTQRCYER